MVKAHIRQTAYPSAKVRGVGEPARSDITATLDVLMASILTTRALRCGINLVRKRCLWVTSARCPKGFRHTMLGTMPAF